LRQLTLASALKPENDAIQVNLAVYHQRQKEFNKAEEILGRLAGKNPQDGNLHFRLGLLYRSTGRYGEAISELTKAMELAPDIINPYEELGNLYLETFGDIEKAKYYYAKGIENAPHAPKIEELKRRLDLLRGAK
jgi:tetratricopeptide (TPR) repeat protein